MLPIEEVAKWLIKNRTDENGDLDLMGLDFSDFDGDVLASGWKVKKGLAQSHNAVGGSLLQSLQTVGGILRQDGQKVKGRIIQDLDALHNDFATMSPAERGKFIIDVFSDLDLSYVDLSDFKGDVAISSWKVGGDLFLDHQEVKGSLHQNNQKVGRNLFQDEQEVEGFIAQDEQRAKDKRMCVEPDYKAEYERLKKELYEADKKIETLMWALEKAKEANK